MVANASGSLYPTNQPLDCAVARLSAGAIHLHALLGPSLPADTRLPDCAEVLNLPETTGVGWPASCGSSLYGRTIYWHEALDSGRLVC